MPRLRYCITDNGPVVQRQGDSSTFDVYNATVPRTAACTHILCIPISTGTRTPDTAFIAVELPVLLPSSDAG